MSTTRTQKELEDRRRRVIEHARAGATMGEICDLEGLDPTNVKDWHKLIRDAGVQIEMVRHSDLPSGLTYATSGWRARIGNVLRQLRREHSQIETSRLTGMTLREIKKAQEQPPMHDWTFSQLYRLSVASGVPLEKLLIETHKEPFT